MCGCYGIRASKRQVHSHFQLDVVADRKPSCDVARRQDVPKVTSAGGKRRLALYHWGLVPFCSKEIGKYSTICARRGRCHQADLPETVPGPALSRPGERLFRVAAARPRQATLVHPCCGRRVAHLCGILSGAFAVERVDGRPMTEATWRLVNAHPFMINHKY